jgi:hypothetical protein
MFLAKFRVMRVDRIFYPVILGAHELFGKSPRSDREQVSFPQDFQAVIGDFVS